MSRTIITIISFLFCSAVLYAAFISPQYHGALARYEYIGQLNEALSQSSQLQAHRDDLVAQKNSIPEQQQRLIDRQVSPHASDSVVTFILSLNELLALNGFSSESYSIENSITNVSDDIVLLPILFSLENIEYTTALRFIAMFERWERGVQIASIRISQNDVEQVSGTQVNMVMTIQALFSHGGEQLY